MPVFICSAAAVFAILLGIGSIAMAGSINGFAEWNYSGSNSTAQESGKDSTKSRADSLVQRYNLSMLTNPLPMLRLSAGSLFEQQFTRTGMPDPGRNSTLTTWQPSMDLSLLNPVYKGGIGYSRREESTNATATPTVKLINDDYRIMLGWVPLGLPSMDMQLTRSNRYDPLKVQQDTTTDRASLSLRYLPVKAVDLRYQFVYNDITDNLQKLEVTDRTNTGRASYSGQFFDKRISLFTNYNVSEQSISTSMSGDGFVDFQLFPASGLYSLNDTPQAGTLSQESQLIDGNTTVGSGINIGTTPPPGDTMRNIGVDFFSETEVNHIMVWIDRQLPAAIASTYSWEIYTSSDNVTWTLRQTLSSAPFGPFDNRFDLQFDTLKARYIKVVTRPLSQVAASQLPTFRNPDRIFVTELQTFLRRAANETRGESSITSHMYSLDLKAKILDTPSLYYNGSFFITAGGVPSTLRYTLSNGLNVNHRLTEKLTITGRVGREDIEEVDGHTVGYLYDASLKATPLKTLSNSLLYSGRVDFRPAGTVKTNSLYAFNTAEIYKGINLNIGGGSSFVTNESGVSTNSSNLIFGMGLVPNSSLSANLNYTLNHSTQSGGVGPQSFSNQRGELSLAWRPFRALYLFGALGFVDQADRPMDMTQNYVVNWAPFPDGTLQFNFAVSENMQTQNSARTRLITPSLTWEMTSRMVLDASFSLIDTDSTLGKTSVRIVSSNLRINF
jgi:hypothetical protein